MSAEQDKILILKIDSQMTNARQILNMGGPWVADLNIDDELISTDVICDNLLYQKENDLLFFIKFHVLTRYRYFFTINFYHLSKKHLFEFETEFNMVYLGNFISKNQLEIYQAFHDEFDSTKQIFNLDTEDFQQIN